GPCRPWGSCWGWTDWPCCWNVKGQLDNRVSSRPKRSWGARDSVRSWPVRASYGLEACVSVLTGRARANCEPDRRPFEGEAALRGGGALPLGGPALPGGGGAQAGGGHGRPAVPVRQGHGRADLRRVRRGRLRGGRPGRAARDGQRRLRA